MKSPTKLWQLWLVLAVCHFQVVQAGIPPTNRPFTSDTIKTAPIRQGREPEYKVRYTRKLYYSIIISAVAAVLLILLVWAVINQVRMRRQARRLRLQSLHLNISPHFFANSLMGLGSFLKTDADTGPNYLADYGKLIRTVMESSQKDFIPLTDEIALLETYARLEQMRMPGRLSIDIEVDPQLLQMNNEVPNMLLQPFVENAIWHGILDAGRSGTVSIRMSRSAKGMQLLISDDGIGFEAGSANTRADSTGIVNAKQRITLLNKIYRTGIKLEIRERSGSGTGTEVLFSFPYRRNR